MMDSISSEIDCLKNEAGFVRLADHGVIELTGEDRQKFLLTGRSDRSVYPER